MRFYFLQFHRRSFQAPTLLQYTFILYIYTIQHYNEAIYFFRLFLHSLLMYIRRYGVCLPFIDVNKSRPFIIIIFFTEYAARCHFYALKFMKKLKLKLLTFFFFYYIFLLLEIIMLLDCAQSITLKRKVFLLAGVITRR